MEGHEKKADELAACTPPTKYNKAAEESPLMSEVNKVRMTDDNSQSTLSRLAKMEICRRQVVLSQVRKAVKVNIKLGLQGPTG